LFNKKIVSKPAAHSLLSILLLVIMLATGCASNNTEKRDVESYLDVPPPANAHDIARHEKAKYFLKALVDRKDYHLTYINQEKDKGTDTSHSKMCVKEIESIIRDFSWPVTTKDLTYDRRDILEHINHVLRCNSVSAPG